ncbi:hypothetical protein [Tateyamaria sp. syn59]|uniref:hypothetical protein n=1 Tax=Tateyamaria sp. syn59 TaxID=2576942 RepID=UPI0011BE56AE|nr:hypothetical protein [Tateyamaria sp. syn59]
MAQAITLRFLTILVLIWAGGCIGGNLVAAPAKFTVDALELPLALQVGRAQFAWIGYVEWAFLAAIAVVTVLSRTRPPALIVIATALFLVQQLGVQPMLEARSDLIIAGAPYSDATGRHLIFVALEVSKVVCLIAAGWMMIRLRT